MQTSHLIVKVRWVYVNLSSLLVVSLPREHMRGRSFGSRNSVHLSVTRVDCDQSKWCTADILISHERAITLLL